MFIEQFYTEKDSRILISKQQASNFAKQIADDFNPLHDPDNKSFCVPGDLLFSLILNKYGLSQQMSFTFSGMVGDNVPLHFPPADKGEFSITDDNDNHYLDVEHSGDISKDEAMISGFAKNYVAFSGMNFPDLIVPLMEEHDVMINPDRPMVIYNNMSIEFDSIDIQNPILELVGTNLSVQGKKAIALLEFAIKSNGETVGKGLKKLMLRGLLKYDQERVDRLVESFKKRKASFASKL